MSGRIKCKSLKIRAEKRGLHFGISRFDGPENGTGPEIRNVSQPNMGFWDIVSRVLCCSWGSSR